MYRTNGFHPFSQFTQVFVLLVLFLLPFFGEAQILKRYTCVVDHLTIDGFEHPTDTTIAWDERGVIMKNEFYHPNRVNTYSLLCHQKFLDTGDSTYYFKFLNQIQFYTDSLSSRATCNDRGIGLPYNFDFHDLKAPWYSAMSQGEAISVLLRYRELTADTTLDRIIKGLKYHLTQPEEVGGTVSNMLQEPWLEEYPNSNEAKHVLNGGINGLIGLFEYCQVFKEDQSAKQLLDMSITTLINRLPDYTRKDWSRYDLTDRFCNPNYMRYHVRQMMHLYELTDNKLFKTQAMLWSSLLNEVIHDDGMSMLADYSFPYSIRAIPDSNWMTLDHYRDQFKLDSSEVITYDDERITKPWFGHYQSLPVHVEESSRYRFALNFRNTPYLRVFFKAANSEDELESAEYSPLNWLMQQEVTLKKGYYRFMVSFEVVDHTSAVGMLNLLPIE